MYWVSHLNWEAADAIRWLSIFQSLRIEKYRKVDWTKEEEYTLIEAIQTAGDVSKGTCQSTEIRAETNTPNIRMSFEITKRIFAPFETFIKFGYNSKRSFKLKYNIRLNLDTLRVSISH